MKDILNGAAFGNLFIGLVMYSSGQKIDAQFFLLAGILLAVLSEKD